MEHLEFLRLEGTVEVYQDKNSGEEVYIGRTKPSPEAVFKVAAKIITENMINPGQTSLKDRAAEDVAKAIKELEEVAKEFPNFWRVHWFLGKGQQAIGDIEESYKAFKRAWELEQENEAVPRELGGACLELGKAKEAVEVGEKAAALQPDNPESACAYLVAARLDEALTTINAALKLAPDDSVNRHLQSVIDDVRSGAIPQPARLRDLTQR
jgi:tetratricopeptide (TPR) repeat protein